MIRAVEERLRSLHDWVVVQPYVGVLVLAAEKGRADHARDMAASVAYFTFVSLFPLMMGLVALGGYVLSSEDMQFRVNQLIVEVFPASADFVMRSTDSLIRIRGAAGITSVLLLIWAGSKMVGALSRAINRALGQQRGYAIYLSSLRNFGLTLIVATLIILTLAISPLLEVLAELKLDFIGDRWNDIIELVAGRTSSLFTTVVLVGIVYGLVPHHRLPISAILPGLITASLLIEIGKAVFVWYVETASDYSAVYGSLSSIIVLLIWLYFSAFAVHYGAEVISIVRQKQAANE